MSIFSMTGFGKSESSLQGVDCVIEIRSVNSRFLETSIKIPKNFAYLENELKNIIKDRLVRGSINLSVTLGGGDSGNIPLSYNENAVKSFINLTKDLQEKYQISGEIKIERILTLPDVLQFSGENTDNQIWEEHLKRNLNLAINEVILMREKEGQNLTKDLEKRINHLKNVLEKIENIEPNRIEIWKEKFY